MILTDKSIRKNLNKVLGAGNYAYYMYGTHGKYKKSLLVVTNDDKIMFLRGSFFGPLKVQGSFNFMDISYFDFMIKAPLGQGDTIAYHYLMKLNNGEEIRGKVQTMGLQYKNSASTLGLNINIGYSDHFPLFVKTIYLRKPEVKPDYIGDKILYAAFYTKTGTVKLLSDKTIFQEFQKKTFSIKTVKEIKAEEIESFEIIPAHQGNDIWVLKLKGEAKPMKTRIGIIKPYTDIELLKTWQISEPFSQLFYFVYYYQQQGVKNYKPSYLEEGEYPLYETRAATGSSGAFATSGAFSKEFVRFTNKGIIFLKRQKDNVNFIKRIQYSDITEASAVKRVHNALRRGAPKTITFDLTIKTNSGKTVISGIEHDYGKILGKIRKQSRFFFVVIFTKIFLTRNQKQLSSRAV